MDPRCVPIEELARVRDLPEGSPERAHAETCPRCRAALLAIAEFEREGDALPAEAGAGPARVRLDAVIESLTGDTPQRILPTRATAGRDGAGWLARLFAPPAVRFAGAFAALAIVAASLWLTTRGPADRLERGASAPTSAASVSVTPAGWRLSWPAVAGAESYDVVFLSADLREVGRVRDVRANELLIARDALPPGVAPGIPLLVEIDALNGGRILGMSEPVPVEFR
ncbi:MAG: hypothetical protein IT347_14635 [Candidatus Eisenbacteria bacterium]|nr:hypothetical protein [Candidatus Eisenbacteria bacterium]